MQNYPKVCFGCSRPHIEKMSDEVTVEDGAKVFHKSCAPSQDEIPTQEIPAIVEKVEEKVVEEGQTVKEKVVGMWDHIFGAEKKEGEVA